MFDFEARWATEVFQTICPIAGDQPVDEKRYARFLQTLDSRGRLGLRVGVLLLQVAPFLFIGRFAFLRSLSPEDRDVYLDKWYEHNWYTFRQVALLVKLFASVFLIRNRSFQVEKLGFREESAWNDYADGKPVPPLMADEEDEADVARTG